MEFEYSPRCTEMREKLLAFMASHVEPAEARYHDEIARNRAAGNPWVPLRVIEELKTLAKQAGLWNRW